jgi:hypothetical protein
MPAVYYNAQFMPSPNTKTPTTLTTPPLTTVPPIPEPETFPAELPPRALAPTRQRWWRNLRLYVAPRPTVSPYTNDVEMGTMPQRRYQQEQGGVEEGRRRRAWWRIVCSVKIGACVLIVVAFWVFIILGAMKKIR